MEETEKLSLEVTPITTTLAQGINKHRKLGTVSFFCSFKSFVCFLVNHAFASPRKFSA